MAAAEAVAEEAKEARAEEDVKDSAVKDVEAGKANRVRVEAAEVDNAQNLLNMDKEARVNEGAKEVKANAVKDEEDVEVGQAVAAEEDAGVVAVVEVAADVDSEEVLADVDSVVEAGGATEDLDGAWVGA